MNPATLVLMVRALQSGGFHWPQISAELMRQGVPKAWVSLALARCGHPVERANGSVSFPTSALLPLEGEEAWETPVCLRARRLEGANRVQLAQELVRLGRQRPDQREALLSEGKAIGAFLTLALLESPHAWREGASPEPEFQAWLKDLTSESPEIRREATKQVAISGHADSVWILDWIFRNETNPNVLEMANGIAAIDREEYRTLISMQYSQQSVEQRCFVCEIIKNNEKLLISALNSDESEQVRIIAAKNLAKNLNNSVADSLRRAVIEDKSMLVQNEALKSIASWQAPYVTDLIQSKLRSEHPEQLRVAVVAGIINLDFPFEMIEYIDSLEDKLIIYNEISKILLISYSNPNPSQVNLTIIQKTANNVVKHAAIHFLMIQLVHCISRSREDVRRIANLIKTIYNNQVDDNYYITQVEICEAFNKYVLKFNKANSIFWIMDEINTCGFLARIAILYFLKYGDTVSALKFLFMKNIEGELDAVTRLLEAPDVTVRLAASKALATHEWRLAKANGETQRPLETD